MIDQLKTDIESLEALFTPEQLQHVKALRALYQTLEMLEQRIDPDGL